MSTSNSTPNASFPIRIKTMDSRTIEVLVTRDLTIQNLKTTLSQTCQIPASRQRLIFHGRVLRNDLTIADYNIESNHVIHLVLHPEDGSEPRESSLQSMSQPESAHHAAHGRMASSIFGANTGQTHTRTFQSPTGNVSVTTSSQVINNPTELLTSVLNAFGANNGVVTGTTGTASATAPSTSGFQFSTAPPPRSGTAPPRRRTSMTTAQRAHAPNNTTGNATNAPSGTTTHTHHHEHPQQQQHQQPQRGHPQSHQHHHHHPHHHHSSQQMNHPNTHFFHNPAWISQIPQSLNTMHTAFHDAHSALSRLSSLLARQTTLSPQEQQEVILLRHRALYFLDETQNQMQRMSTQLRNKGFIVSDSPQQQNTTTTDSQRAPVQHLNVHVHSTVDQLDILPDRLSEFTNRINLTRTPNVRRPTPSMFTAPQQPGTNRHTVTIVRSNTGPPEQIIQQLSQPRLSTTQQQQQTQPTNPAPTEAQIGANLSQLSSALSSALTGNASPVNVNMTEILTSDRSVGSVMRDFGSRLGYDAASEESAVDAFLNVIFEHINVLEIMGIINGTWGPIERVREPLRIHIIDRILNKDDSADSRRRSVESGLRNIEQALRNNQEFMDELHLLKKPDASVDQLIRDLIGISRTYLRLLVDTVLDGPECVLRSGLLSEQQTSISYSNAMHCIVSFYLGEAIDLLHQNVNGNTNAERLIFLLTKRLMSGLPQDFRDMETLGGNMTTNFVLKEYREYKAKYPNRAFHKTEEGENSADLHGSGESNSVQPSGGESSTTTNTQHQVSDHDLNDDSDDMLD